MYIASTVVWYSIHELHIQVFFIAGFLYIYHDVQKSSTVGVILDSLDGTSKSLVPSKTSVTMTEAGGIRRVLVR